MACRNDRGERGAIDAGKASERSQRRDHRCAGMAGAEQRGCASIADCFGCHLDGRAGLAPKRDGRLLRHLDAVGGVEDLDVERAGSRVARQFALDQRPVSGEQQADLEVPGGNERPVNDCPRAVIAAHGVDGYAQLEAGSYVSSTALTWRPR